MSASTVAVVQAAPKMFDLAGTLQKVADLTAAAAGKGAKLVLFPEAFVSAYPKGLDFGARIGFRAPSGRRDFLRYYQSSVAVPSPATDALAAVARENAVHLVIGVIERGGGTLYCTVLFFGPDGAYLGKHRKLMPTASERLVWGFGDGSTMPVIDTPLGKMGAVICWENYMPLFRTFMYSQGVQLYLAPTADSRETWLSSMRHIAMEGRCYVLTCCQYLTREDCPPDYPLDGLMGDQEILMGGGSAIISPLGEVLAGPDFSGENILTAEVDLDQVAAGKYDLDTVGHYARPDVFQLHVNTRPAPPVVAHRGQPPDPFSEKE